MAITSAQITWETLDGETFGYFDLGDDGDIEISITGRINRSMWTTGTNDRAWAVDDENNNRIAYGYADGLRNAKRDALKALNDHLAKRIQSAG
jgi:hypothetical protein